MLAVREQEPDINYKTKPITSDRVNNTNKNKTSTENISNVTLINKNGQKSNLNKDSNFAKGEFETLFSINSEKQKLEFIQNYELASVEELINSKIEFPENHLIVVINTKKALMDLAGEKIAKPGKHGETDLEFDFNKTLFKRMWEVIINFSQNLKRRSLVSNKNAKSKNIGKPEIYESIKIFTLNNNLEFYCTITEALSEESAQKLYLPLLRKCLSFSAEAQECDLLRSLSQLFSAMQSNNKLFAENFKAQESNFYINNSALPEKSKFYRILFFNGTITESINTSAFENKLVSIKGKYNLVFNYFLFEHDFQFEKKIYPLLLKNNMIDYKNSDFEVFMKKDDFDEELQGFNDFIANLHEKANLIEKQMISFFEAFAETKNLFFGNASFREYQKKYDTERSNLMQDFEIISKNNSKFFEFSKANVNKPQIDYIRKYFSEMLNKNVVGNLLQNVKSAIDFSKFNSLLNRMIEEANGLFDSLTRDLNNLLISLKDKDLKCDYYLEKVNFLLALVEFMKTEFNKIKFCDLVLDATAKHMEFMAKLQS